MVYTPEYEYLGVFIIFISLFWFMVEISMVYTPEYEYLGVLSYSYHYSGRDIYTYYGL